MTDAPVNYGNGGCALLLTAMPDAETMGQRIKRLREAKDLSQSELARRLGITRASVHQWENDTSPNIRPTNLLALAEILGTDVYYLVFGSQREPAGGFPSIGGDDSGARTGRYRTPFRRTR